MGCAIPRYWGWVGGGEGTPVSVLSSSPNEVGVKGGRVARLAKFDASLPHRRGVDDRRDVFDVVKAHPVKQSLVSVVEVAHLLVP